MTDSSLVSIKPGDKVVLFTTVKSMEPWGVVEAATGRFVPDDPPHFYPVFDGIPIMGQGVKPDPTPIIEGLLKLLLVVRTVGDSNKAEADALYAMAKAWLEGQ